MPVSILSASAELGFGPPPCSARLTN
jgi:hypothetical protein